MHGNSLPPSTLASVLPPSISTPPAFPPRSSSSPSVARGQQPPLDRAGSIRDPGRLDQDRAGPASDRGGPSGLPPSAAAVAAAAAAAAAGAAAAGSGGGGGPAGSGPPNGNGSQGIDLTAGITQQAQKVSSKCAILLNAFKPYFPIILVNQAFFWTLFRHPGILKVPTF